MKKILLLFILAGTIAAQTGIITPKNFYGLGLWVESNRPFNGDVEIFYDFKTELYIPGSKYFPLGTELSFSGRKYEGEDVGYSGSIGLHYKFKISGISINGSRREYDTHVDRNLYSENFYLTFYKTGKLNPFISFINKNILGDNINNNKTLDYINIGGNGRITRHVTLTSSVMLPILDNKVLIEEAWIEFSLGYEIGSAFLELFKRP